MRVLTKANLKTAIFSDKPKPIVNDIVRMFAGLLTAIDASMADYILRDGMQSEQRGSAQLYSNFR